VLPVLALKTLSFIKHGGGTAPGVRLSFLATSAGILFSFLVMAGIIISLKELGMSVGWGVQFQQPVFLIFLIAILLAFSASLWGFFEIPLPRFLADRLNWTQGHGNLFKDFLSGAFATLLATPCTAPFLGTAVGFALAAGAGEVLTIFMALGVGLAAPYLLIAAAPKLATYLPKPGNWMHMVKRVMALALALTAAWLIFVLAVETNQASDKDAAWMDFDRAKIAEFIAQDKIVFVDVTAEWCLTCKANKKFALETEDVKARFAALNVIKMKADWTKPDPVIGVFLKDYGRFGIPFNIIYSKTKPEGVILPELLTKQAVTDALDKAIGK
jgi:suppressor for copper-sensitivity B